MFGRSTFAYYFLAGGAALGLLGLVLWRALPISSTLPPFLFTSLLAIGYGAFELWRERRS
jgi:hypothetical protein